MKGLNQGFYKITIFVFALFLASSVFTTSSLPRSWYAVTLFLVLVFAILSLSRQASIVQTPSGILVSFFTIYLLYLIGALIEPYNYTQVVRALILIFVSSCCVFVLPTVVRRDYFLKIITLIATSILLIGIPASFVGDYSIGPFHTMLYWEHYDVFGYEVDQITSLMSNPNPVGKLAFFGLLSSFVWFDQKRLWLSVASVCALGLLLSGSRAAFLSTFGALFVYVIGISRLSEKFNEIIMFGVAFGGIGYLMLMRILPAPEFVQSINLSYRLSIWNAALDAGFAKPILGHGPENVADAVRPYSNGYVGAGVYNSFIRLFVTTGIFGAVSYIYIFFYSIVRYTPDLDHQSSVIIYAMLIGYAIDELFSGNSIFGISIMSVVSACLIGYIAYDSIDFYENG